MPRLSSRFACLSALVSVGCFGSPGASPPTASGGASGTGSGGSASVSKDPSNYPNTAGAAFPFPQNRPLPHCTFPNYDTDTVEEAYANWKTAFVTASGATAGPNNTTCPACLRVQRPENSNDTVSEGIGYGMLMAVYMNDRPTFDGLWAYGQFHFDGNHLMTWDISATGSVLGANSATDGDEDMAYALLMAGKQWDPSYATAAATLIGNIMHDEISGNVVEGGDGFHNATEIDLSYFAPSYYRAFAAATGSSAWMTVLDGMYGILQSAQGSYGLAPNWVSPSGVGSTQVDATNGPYFGYDACRIPFRVGIDYCLNGEPRAKTYADLITAFYASKAPNALSMLSDGYTTTGRNPPGTLGDYSAGMAFFGPGAVAAMDGTQPEFLRLAYTGTIAETTGPAMKASGIFSYFHASWGVLTLIATSGNFWDMTAP